MKLIIKFAVVLFLIGVLVLSVIGVFTFISTTNLLKESAYSRQEELADHVLLSMDIFLHERFMGIQEMATGELLEAFVDFDNRDVLDIEERLFEIKKFSGPWDLISMVDSEAKVLVSTHDELFDTAIDREDKLFTAFESALGGEVYHSDAYISEETDRPTVVFAAPLQPSALDEPVGVLLAQYSWPDITKLLDSPVASNYLFNSSGLLIATNDPANQDKAFTYDGADHLNLSTEENSTEFKEMIFGGGLSMDVNVVEKGELHYKGNGWILMSEVPSDVVLGFIYPEVFKITVLMIGFLALFVLGVLMMGNKLIISPLSVLTRYADDIAGGKMDISSADFSSFDDKRGDEIGKLQRSFKAMVNKVKYANIKLSEQIRITKEEQARLVASIRDLPIGFILIDIENNILHSNSAVSNIFNFRHDKWTFEDINKQLTDGINLTSYCEQCTKTKKPQEIKELEISGKRFLRVFIVPVIMIKDHEEVIGTVILLEDITEAKLLNQTRDEFFAVASHELRTPLTSIRGNASLIQDYFGDQFKDEDLKDMLSDIHSSSVRLIEIVEDFLDTSRLEQGKIKFKKESFDVLSLISESARELEKAASEKGLSLAIEKVSGSLPQVLADKDKTKQVVVNLISNGLKFTQKGGVSVRAKVQDNFVKVEVVDTGVGVSLENQKMLFRKFTQSGSDPLTRDATQGTGLGLYISRLIVEGMGGKIELTHSAPGEGSIFAFTIPMAKL